MSKIAIIDDAICDQRLHISNIIHFHLENGAFHETNSDPIFDENITHGTLVASILQEYAKEFEIINIQIIDNWFTQHSCSSDRLVAALDFCKNLDIDIIHCSLGTERLSRIGKIGNLLNSFEKRKIPVIAAGSNAMYRTIPASCHNVFGVMQDKDDILPPGRYALANNPYLGTEFVANYKLPDLSNCLYPKSSSLAAPVVTAQVNALINEKKALSFNALKNRLKSNALNEIAPTCFFEDPILATTLPEIPIVYLVEIFADNITKQRILLDIFATNGFESVGLTYAPHSSDVRLIPLKSLRNLSGETITNNVLASTKTDLLIVFLPLEHICDWDKEIKQNLVLSNSDLQAEKIRNPHYIYNEILNLFK